MSASSELACTNGSSGRGGGCACVGLPPTAPIDTAALRGRLTPPDEPATGRSTADGEGKPVAGDTGGSEPDRERETEESRCPAVSGKGGSSALIVG